MTVTALFPSKEAPAASDALYLGPASVTSVDGGELALRFPDGRTQVARLALAFTYEAAVGDDVLAIQKAGEPAWVIGVVRSTGRGVLSFPGDLEVRSTGGKLTLGGDAGVAIEGPDVEIRAGKLRMFAGAVLQHVESFSQRVRELYTLHAGQTHTIVEGTSLSQSKRAKIVTEETVSINGREIHLG